MPLWRTGPSEKFVSDTSGLDQRPGGYGVKANPGASFYLTGAIAPGRFPHYTCHKAAREDLRIFGVFLKLEQVDVHLSGRRD